MPISENARAVLERRYLIRDEHGEAVETVDELFYRVADAVAAADTLEAKQAAATNASNAMSQKVYNTTLKMYNKLQAKTAARAWVSSLLH